MIKRRKSTKPSRAPQQIDPICSDCGSMAVLKSGAEVYPHRSDLHGNSVYVCPCGARVGCHPGTQIALGYPAGPATRQARHEAHAAFDPIWKAKVATGMSAGEARGRGYGWLAEQLGIDKKACHIAMMDRATAERVAALCRPILARIKASQSRVRTPGTVERSEPGVDYNPVEPPWD